MKQAHLDYFKSLFEGTAELSWNAWFPQHEAELAEELPRADFLRLKFYKLDEAEKYLQEAGIRYRIDPVAARRERYYARLHPVALDAKGRVNEGFLRKAYNGAVGQLMDGDIEGAKTTLAAFIRRVKRYRVGRRMVELESMCFDGEMALADGGQVIGRALLEAVASVPEGNDLVDPAIHRAKELLDQKTQ